MASPITTEPIPTGLRLTLLDPVFREDPYPILAELRERDPIHRDSELGRFVFTRHDDVVEILRHTEYWSDPRKGNPGSFTRRFFGGDTDEEPSMRLMAEALSALLDRFPQLEFGDRGHVYAASPSFRGCSEFWVRGDRWFRVIQSPIPPRTGTPGRPRQRAACRPAARPKNEPSPSDIPLL